ncbi:MAG: hypothetical protein CMG15_05800, partial [Candidatus Marinimicrobia bacterium]|nr:hypothetical protein [Candidatus Neomarinimicrobiota bacterium]
MKGENRVRDRLDGVELWLTWVLPIIGILLGLYKWVIQSHAPFFFLFTLIPPVLFGYTVEYLSNKQWRLSVWRTDSSQDGFQSTIGLIYGGFTQLLLFCLGNSLLFTNSITGKLEWVLMFIIVGTIFGLLFMILSIEDGFYTIFNASYYKNEGSVRTALRNGITFYSFFSFLFSIICMIGHSFLMGSVPITFFLWLVIVGSFFLITPFLIIGYTSFQQLEEYRLSNEGMEAQSDTIASILKYRKRIFQSIVIVLLSSFVIFISWTVNMSKRDIPNYISPDIKLARDLITAPGDTSLLLSLVPGKKGPFTLCPEFDNRIRRYSWVPQSERDVLTLVPKYDDAVIAVSLNERTIPKSGPIKIPGNKPGKEYKISLRSGDESKSADYVVVVLPTSFIPLQVKIHDIDMVGDGFIFAGNFTVPKFRDWSMIFRDTYEEWGSDGMWNAFFNTIYSRFTIPEQSSKQADTPIPEPSRPYLPYIYVLDKYGTPLFYQMSGFGFSAFRPYKYGFHYGSIHEYIQYAIGLGRTNLLDDNFEPAGSQIIPLQDVRTELHEFRWLDDGRIIQIGSKTHPWPDGRLETIESGYIYITDEEGNKIFEWDSYDHVPIELSSVPVEEWSMRSYDYFHMNNVTPLTDGNYLVSARHTQTV